MYDQLDIEDYIMRYPHNPGYKEQTTSKDAAKAISHRVGVLRARVMDILANNASTAKEVAKALGEEITSVRPRLTELKLIGKIGESGIRRNKQHVWKVL